MRAFVLLVLFCTAPAHAVLVTTSIGKYEISLRSSTVDVAFEDIQSQPWFRSAVLAEEFARAVDCALSCDPPGNVTYFFLHTLFIDNNLNGEPDVPIYEGFDWHYWNGAFVIRPGQIDEFLDRSTPELCDGNGNDGPVRSCSTVTYAVAKAVTEPSSMGLLLLFVSLLMMRRLSQRRLA